MGGLILGIFGDTGSNPSNIELAEVIVYDRVLSAGEDGIVTTYLTDKYNI